MFSHNLLNRSMSQSICLHCESKSIPQSKVQIIKDPVEHTLLLSICIWGIPAFSLCTQRPGWLYPSIFSWLFLFYIIYHVILSPELCLQFPSFCMIFMGVLKVSLGSICHLNIQTEKSLCPLFASFLTLGTLFKFSTSVCSSVKCRRQ